MPSMAQVLRPVEMLSELQEVLLLKDPALLRDILERISQTTDGLERGIKTEVKAREEAVACVAKQHEAISQTLNSWDGRMHATESRLDAMHQQLNSMRLSVKSSAEAGVSAAGSSAADDSVEHVLRQVQQDVQKLRADFVDTSGPSQSAAKITARVDKLEKQLKVHKEESWSRLANAEKRCETQETTFHAEVAQRVGRRELVKSLEELRQQLFKTRCDLCREAADMEQSLQGCIQVLRSDSLQLRSQLSALSIEMKECVSKSQEASGSTTKAQSVTQGTQVDMPESLRAAFNGLAESKDVPLPQQQQQQQEQKEQHSGPLPWPMRRPATSRPVGRRPFSEEPRPCARHVVAHGGSAVPDSKCPSPGIPCPLHSTHEEQMTEGLPTHQAAQPPRCRSKRRSNTPGRLKSAIACSQKIDVRSLVVEACRVQSARSVAM